MFSKKISIKPRALRRVATGALAATGAAIGPASAHMGHVGEAAGHAHWIGLAALSGAAALAAWIAWQKDETGEDAPGDAEVANGDADATPGCETEEAPA